MLTWQGTDDDGNFEISRADAAVLAMSGLCGLDPDRIPACAAAAEVQAAYDRGFDDGLDAATPTGSNPPPPPVTVPAEPATAAEKCDAVRYGSTRTKRNGWNLGEGTQKVDGWHPSTFWQGHVTHFVIPGVPKWKGIYDSNGWDHYYAADLEDGWFVCTSYSLETRQFIIRNHEGEIEDLPLPSGERVRAHDPWHSGSSIITQYHHHYLGPEDQLAIWVYSRCWVTRTDPVTGEEYYEQPRRHGEDKLYYERPLYGETRDMLGNPIGPPLGYEEHPLISSAIRSAIAGDRPDPDLWPAHDPADCPTTGTPFR